MLHSIPPWFLPANANAALWKQFPARSDTDDTMFSQELALAAAELRNCSLKKQVSSVHHWRTVRERRVCQQLKPGQADADRISYGNHPFLLVFRRNWRRAKKTRRTGIGRSRHVIEMLSTPTTLQASERTNDRQAEWPAQHRHCTAPTQWTTDSAAPLFSLSLSARRPLLRQCDRMGTSFNAPCLKPGFHPNATHATQAIALGWKPGFSIVCLCC